MRALTSAPATTCAMRCGRSCLVLCLLLLIGCGDERSGGVDATVLETYDPGDEADGDRRVLEQLERAGADLTKETDVRWYVYFAEKRQVSQFNECVRGQGWTTSIELGARPGSWGCICSRDAVPSLATIAEMRSRLAACAEGLDADIDGWEAAVTK